MASAMDALASLLLSAASSPLTVAASVTAGLVVLSCFVGVITARRLPPGPLQIPLLGDAAAFTMTDPTHILWRRFAKYGSIFKAQFLTKVLYVVSDLDVLRPLLRDEGAFFDLPFKSFDMLMEKTKQPLASPYAHPHWRRLFLGAVGPANLEPIAPRVLEVVDGHIAGWATAGRISLFEASKSLSMDLAMDVIAGLRLAHVDHAWLKERLSTYLSGLYGVPLNLPGSSLARAIKAKNDVIKAMEPEFAEDHRHLMDKLSGASSPEEAVKILQAGSSGEGPRVTVMQAQVAGRWILGGRDVREHCMALLHTTVAGADTTRFALFSVPALVAASPRVQQALYEEQQQVIKAHGPELTFAAAHQHMPYMDAMIKEAMRLIPASAGSMRTLTVDVTAGKYVMPKGSMMWYNPGLMHCIDPVLWDGDKSAAIPPHMDYINNLEEAFKPERWMQESTRPRYYYTFGSGIHPCAGMNLVYLELKLLMARLVRQFRLELQTPNMLATAQKFPLMLPKPGTDVVLLKPRQEPAAMAA